MHNNKNNEINQKPLTEELYKEELEALKKTTIIISLKIGFCLLKRLGILYLEKNSKI